MKSALIMCNADPAGDPRPNRMIHCLKDSFKVTVAARGKPNIDGVKTLILPANKKMNLTEKMMFATNLKARRFEHILWPEKMKKICQTLLRNSYDLIIIHDLYLLPLALSAKKNAKVLFDAREYYPRHYEDQLYWRFFFQSFNKYLCSAYLHQCDRVITVSDGIAEEYYKNYGVNADVIMSLPFYHHYSPSQTNPRKINVIYHGNANPSRRTDLMIEIMDYLDHRFTLDLMLMPSDPPYLRKLTAKANKRQNVKIIPPVSYNKIIPFTNNYDIGLFLFPPTTLNLKYGLGNKLFEFIQARLAVAVGPSIEWKKIVEKWDCGVVANDFKPKTLAKALNNLTAEKIIYYKQRSNQASQELNAEANCQKIKAIVHKLTEAQNVLAVAN